MSEFDAIADEYNAGRPSYPDALYDELEPLTGRSSWRWRRTGIATGGLLERGAQVVPFDLGWEVLQRARRAPPGSAR